MESPSNFLVIEEKNIEIDQETMKLYFNCLKWTYRHSSIDYRVALLFTGYLDLESPSNLQVKGKKNIEIDPETTKLCFNCLKWMYGRSSIDYRVASLFTSYWSFNLH